MTGSWLYFELYVQYFCYYNKCMEIEFDDAKNQRNLELRGISLELAVQFDFEGALEVEHEVDGEQRYLALGHIGARLYALVYTLRGDAVRVISLRKANKREVRRYEQIREP